MRKRWSLGYSPFPLKVSSLGFVETSSCVVNSLTFSKTSPDFICLQFKSFENTAGQGESASNKQFLAPLAIGQRAYVMVCCPSCVRLSVRASVRALTLSLNIFFSKTTYRILTKFHKNVPAIVLFRISRKNLIPSKTLVAMATELKFF